MKALIIIIWLTATLVVASLSWFIAGVEMVLPAKICLISLSFLGEMLFSVLMGLFWRDV